VQYRARAEAAALEQTSGTVDDFLQSLEMQAVTGPFDELHLPRIVQLIGKTNQFNLTTRRHGLADVRAMMADPTCVHLYLRLRDRFADHGLVGVAIAFARGGVLEIDTWLMSCRVLGRSVESKMLELLCQAAAEHACHALRGVYIPTAKNEPARDIFARYGFEPEGETDGARYWRYDLRTKPPIRNDFISVVTTWESDDERSQPAGSAVS